MSSRQPKMFTDTRTRALPQFAAFILFLLSGLFYGYDHEIGLIFFFSSLSVITFLLYIFGGFVGRSVSVPYFGTESD